MTKWIGWTAALAFSVCCTAGVLPWGHAVVGAVHPPDFAQDIAAARALLGGINPYTADFAPLHAAVLGTTADAGYPALPHPPFAVALGVPFAPFAFESAALLWWITSLAMLFALATLLAFEITPLDAPGRMPSIRTSLLVFCALLAWPPVLYNLEKGQFTIILSLLAAGSWRATVRGQSGLAGICLGAATAIKIFPAVVLGYFLRRDRSPLLSAIATAAVLTGLPMLWLGWETIPAFLRNSQSNVSYWETWPAVSYSVHGLAARLFVGGTWAQPLLHSPALATVFTLASTIVLVAVIAKISWSSNKRDAASGFAGWCILAVVLNPLAMGHNGVFLALPIVLIGRTALTTHALAPKVMWSLGLAAVSVPRQAIFWLAPPPVDALRSVAVVAVPLWGAILLLGSAVALAASHRVQSQRTVLLPSLQEH